MSVFHVKLWLSLCVLGLWPALVLCGEHAPVDGGKPSGSITLAWENDLFARTDRDYTNGVKLTWSSALLTGAEESERLPGWSRRLFDPLPWMNDPRDRRGFSLSIGHSIYTPVEMTRSDFIADDRPFAGHLYLGLGLHADDGRRLTTWEASLGVVGPLALGEQLQNLAHTLVSSAQANGWEHQLPNQPALDFSVQRKWRVWDWQADNGFGIGILTHLGGHFGNVAIYANGGAELRFGFHLPRDYGSCPIRSACEMNGVTALDGQHRLSDHSLTYHLFAGVDGRAVLYDLFVDGGLNGPDPDIDRRPLVADVMAGISLHYQSIRASYAYVLRTRQFRQQEENQLFGAVTLTYVY